jgi:hypothetical protein
MKQLMSSDIIPYEKHIWVSLTVVCLPRVATGQGFP